MPCLSFFYLISNPATFPSLSLPWTGRVRHNCALITPLPSISAVTLAKWSATSKLCYPMCRTKAAVAALLQRVIRIKIMNTKHINLQEMKPRLSPLRLSSKGAQKLVIGSGIAALGTGCQHPMVQSAGSSLSAPLLKHSPPKVPVRVTADRPSARTPAT